MMKLGAYILSFILVVGLNGCGQGTGNGKDHKEGTPAAIIDSIEADTVHTPVTVNQIDKTDEKNISEAGTTKTKSKTSSVSSSPTRVFLSKLKKYY